MAYFFRQAFALMRDDGVLGLIATNTISQGDTREGGLASILAHGGEIYNAQRRLRWPGLAAVVVSVVHIFKGRYSGSRILDGREVARITAFLLDRGANSSPVRLAGMNELFPLGSKIYGAGFLFDDSKPESNPISLMEDILSEAPEESKRIIAV